MTRPVVVINVVGLNFEMLGENTPNISGVAADGFAIPMGTVLPAVTCTAQATMLSGLPPREHGIVANGWYFRDLAEILFWRQSSHLLAGERIYHAGRRRDAHYTTAKMFWWYNMYTGVDWSVTPRPGYPADGRKIPDVYSHPVELRDWLQEKHGAFPLFRFWGPTADIASTAWIANAGVDVFRRYRPTLTLVYLPHLDYNLQRLGTKDVRITADIRAVDAQAGKLIDAARESGAEVVVLSEYAITDVDQPVHINRILREAGYLTVRREPLGWETLDCGACRAFAVADHQAAHVYVHDPRDVDAVQRLLEATDGIAQVLNREAQRSAGIDHPRSGELVAVSAPEAWFTYYFWLDDELAPDYARTVDIHRKSGYDPAELLVNRSLRFPRIRIAGRLLQKMLGFRYYMDMIGLDATVVRGSHGRLPETGRERVQGPVFVCSSRSVECDDLPMERLKDRLLQLQFGSA